SPWSARDLRLIFPSCPPFSLLRHLFSPHTLSLSLDCFGGSAADCSTTDWHRLPPPMPHRHRLYRIAERATGRAEMAHSNLRSFLTSTTPRVRPQFIPKVSSQTYSLDANLCLLRLFQFEPERMNLQIMVRILVKALMALPAPDFNLCLFLIPERVQKEEQIKTMIVLSHYLETARFRQFWDEAAKYRSILEVVPYGWYEKKKRRGRSFGHLPKVQYQAKGKREKKRAPYQKKWMNLTMLSSDKIHWCDPVWVGTKRVSTRERGKTIAGEDENLQDQKRISGAR
ncbi:hypothetical protein Taro_019302, partial [Colocasia esculenta]|nr:hypothetical protein [Colocasia esculenta]